MAKNQRTRVAGSGTTFQLTDLVIAGHELPSASRLVEFRIHGDRFDWPIEVDHMIIVRVVKAVDDDLKTEPTNNNGRNSLAVFVFAPVPLLSLF